METPPNAITFIVPPTKSVSKSTLIVLFGAAVSFISTSATDTPGIATGVSSFVTIGSKGTVLMGASFTGVTSKRTLAAFVLKAVDPIVVSAVVPAVPEDLSQTLKPRA